MPEPTPIPLGVPVLIEYHKGGRLARSLCFVIAVSNDIVVASGTLDGRHHLGLVTIDVDAIERVAVLEERPLVQQGVVAP